LSGSSSPRTSSRRNEITYDKIAGAHISYGGRGRITDVQQPRYGQQIFEIVVPFQGAIMAKIFPVLILLVGVIIGGSAGMFMRPSPMNVADCSADES
jgi:hypothetical protein